MIEHAEDRVEKAGRREEEPDGGQRASQVLIPKLALDRAVGEAKPDWQEAQFRAGGAGHIL